MFNLFLLFSPIIRKVYIERVIENKINWDTHTLYRRYMLYRRSTVIRRNITRLFRFLASSNGCQCDGLAGSSTDPLIHSYLYSLLL